jgi:short-subunit dehydrogenase
LVPGSKNVSKTKKEKVMAKSVFVTGCAKGIGRVTVELYRERGWTVGGCDLAPCTIEGVKTYVCDVRDTARLMEVLGDFNQHVGHKLDVLVANAGNLTMGSIFAVELDDIARMIETNFTAVAKTMKIVPRYLIKGGTVVAVLSGSLIYGMPCNATYSGSKGGLYQFLQGVEMELEYYNIDLKIKMIISTNVDTDMINLKNGVASEIAANKKWFPAITPMEVARAIFKSVGSRKRDHYVKGHLWILSKVARFAPWLARPIMKLVASGTYRVVDGKFIKISEEEIAAAAWGEKQA